VTHRSYSARQEYLDCSWRFRLHRVLELPEQPAVWFAAGKAFHSTVEDIEHEYAPGIPDLHRPSFWQDRFQEHLGSEFSDLRAVEPDESQWRTGGRVTKDAPNREDTEWWAAQGPSMVLGYLAWRQRLHAQGWQVAHVDGVPAIEMAVEAVLGTTEIKAYVDLVLEDKNGTLLVVDHKTGSRVPPSTEQLGLYSVMLERVFKRPVTWGAYFLARAGNLSPVKSLTMWDEENLGQAYDVLDHAADAGLFMPNIGIGCAQCGFKKYCVWVGGEEPTT